jgi:hypothetical protein
MMRVGGRHRVGGFGDGSGGGVPELTRGNSGSRYSLKVREDISELMRTDIHKSYI